MRLKTLRLHFFRLFKHCEVHFDKGINHFIGGNATGKTTILEALYFLSTGKSIRTHHLQEIIQNGQMHFALELEFIRHGIEHVLKAFYEQGKAIIYLNETKLSSLHGLLGLIQGVIITADDVQMIKKGPQERRELLDLFLFSLNPLYYHHFQRYKKALKHRNALLKMRSTKTLETFEKQLAKSGSYLIKQRDEACREIEKKAAVTLHQLTDASDFLTINYSTQIDPSLSIEKLEETLCERYKDSRLKDSQLCTTSIGPHRDDLIFLINEKQAKLFASEGQQRTLCNALKMAQHQIFSACNKEEAFLCIDDLKMSLDSHRKRLLLNTLKNYNQVFLTSPDRVEDLTNFGKLFHCNKANIQEISSK